MADVGVFFPGYGSQFVGMGKDFYDEYRVVQELFEEASCCADLNFVKLCFASSENVLGKIEHAYPSLFLIHVCLIHVLREHGVEPKMVAGCGVGSMSAWYAAHVVTLADGLYLLRKFTRFYQELLSNGQFALVRVIGVDRQAIDQSIALHEGLAVVATITALQHLVAGKPAVVEKLTQELQQQGFVVADVPVTYGLYSCLMKDVWRQVSAYLEKIDCARPTVKLVCQNGNIVEPGQLLGKCVLTDFVCEPLDIPGIFKGLSSCQQIIQMGPASGTNCAQMLVSSMVKVADLRALVGLTGVRSRKGLFYGCGC